MYLYCNNNPVMYVDPTGKLALTTALLLIGGFIFAGGTIGGIVSYNAAKEEGTSGVDLLNETADGILQGAVVGGIGAFLTVSTAGLLGVPSLAGTLGVSALSVSTVAIAENAEVISLQVKKGIQDGDNGWRIASDCITSIMYNNGRTMLSPLLNEVGVLSIDIGISRLPIDAYWGSMTSNFSGYHSLYQYGETIGNLLYSFSVNDPVARAKERNYILQ